MGVCKYCSDEFEGAGQKRYCSSKCKERARYAKHSEKRSKAVLDYEWSKSPETYCWGSARQRARLSGIDFTITVDDIPKMPKFCPITHLELFRNEGAHGDNSPSLDRVDTTKGYIPGNVRLISYKANRWKSNMSPDEIERLYEYSKGKI